MNEIPEDFASEFEEALRQDDVGKLVLLAQEALEFPWANAVVEKIAAILAGREYYAAANMVRQKFPATQSGMLHRDVKGQSGSGSNGHHILFTGHMIDKPDRKEPRFPPQLEGAAKASIAKEIQQQISIYNRCTGISGGACGGDILFHEVCRENQIPTILFLALPPEKFKIESVEFAGSDWVRRFDKIYDESPVKVLAQNKELPGWLKRKKDYSVWQRNNLWMLYNALINGGENMSLIALWDGKGGDNPGGTEHMVREARRRGASTTIISVKELGR